MSHRIVALPSLQLPSHRISPSTSSTFTVLVPTLRHLASAHHLLNIAIARPKRIPSIRTSYCMLWFLISFGLHKDPLKTIVDGSEIDDHNVRRRLTGRPTQTMLKCCCHLSPHFPSLQRPARVICRGASRGWRRDAIRRRSAIERTGKKEAIF